MTVTSVNMVIQVLDEEKNRKKKWLQQWFEQESSVSAVFLKSFTFQISPDSNNAVYFNSFDTVRNTAMLE
jgi:hypothetical protein